MNISLEDLAQKKVKSTPEVTISDHTITLTASAPKDHELIFTGKGTRGLVIKDAKGKIIFRNATIDNASTGVTVKFDGTYNGIKVDGEGTSKLLGKAGNSASQMIYFQGTWSNVEVCGFEIDQRRNSATGSTTTGAACQFAGVLKSGHNLGRVYIHDMVVRNAGDEGFYVNHFDRGDGYAQGEELIIERCKVYNSGRDFFQQWGFKNVTIIECYGENGGLEADPNHCSAVSMNGWNEGLLIGRCEFKNAAQLIYSGTTQSGKTIKGVIDGVRYDQGTHAGARNNQAAYLKGAGEFIIRNSIINAPAVKEAAITADGSKVIVEGTNKITAPKLSRVFNGGSVVQGNPGPVTVTTKGELLIETTTTWDGVVTVKYFTLINNIKTELIIKL